MTNSTETLTHVAVSGISWTTVGVGLLNLLVGGALVAWIRSRPKMQELKQDAEGKLRDDLITRVEKLERKLDEERVQHEAVVGLMRHRLNNSDQCLDALLMLLETAPDKVGQAVTKIKEMRDRQREAEAVERAAIMAANIAAKTGPTPTTAP